ncbi:MAG TPA: pilus assembly protein PilY, partial [Burkholderiaceae bacterium]|nr:pilus assembly protein PilY [Burkholderiaceae bacterium]
MTAIPTNITARPDGRRGAFARVAAPWLRWGLMPAAAAVSFLSLGVDSPPSIPRVNLSPEPLYAKGTRDKPTLTLALSVEFPTVGAQYVSSPGATVDSSYSPDTEYIGYFDADSCYAYVNDSNPGRSRFDRIGTATSRRCGGSGFSGNFMNWATSSAIDVLRLGLTGGDRIVDEANLTVLQRAVLPAVFWNSQNFPAKQLGAALTADALPSTLIGTYGGDIWVANCVDRVSFGTSMSGSCDAPGDNGNLGVRSEMATAVGSDTLTDDNFFYARVKVCESDGSGHLLDPRIDRCLKYPSGNYKPVGNLQKYSDRVRVAAFGYLMENVQSRYGGVLRAPMKYVGPKAYDPSGTALAGTNAAIEWNQNDGTFVANPDAATEGKSGVINYLNQFGRTGTTPGTYKTYDPVGELYYESLRYLQGLPPTPQATDGMTDAMKDGFPVYGSWIDPHEGGSKDKDYSCLRNNILLIGDVNTHNDKSIPGNTTRLL